MTGSSCTLAQLRLIFKMRGIAGQISPPSQNGVTAKHSGKMTLSGCLFYTSANVKWGSDIKRSHFECGAKCSREALSYWLNPVMLNVSTDRAKELQVYKLDMINVFFFQHSERHEPIGMKREHRVLTAICSFWRVWKIFGDWPKRWSANKRILLEKKSIEAWFIILWRSILESIARYIEI